MATRDDLPGVWRPMRELSRMQRRMDQIFEDLFSSVPAVPAWGGMGMLEDKSFSPPIDVEESENQFWMRFDLPGVRKEDIKIEMHENQLIVSGERKEERKQEEGKRSSYERFYGSFFRALNLPQNVDPNRIEARYENGVLEVILPKVEVAQSKKIEVKEGKLLGASAQSKAGKAA